MNATAIIPNYSIHKDFMLWSNKLCENGMRHLKHQLDIGCVVFVFKTLTGVMYVRSFNNCSGLAYILKPKAWHTFPQTK